MLVGGHTYVIVLHAFAVMIIAELIRRIGHYNSFKYNMLSFAIFNTWICGSLMQMLWAREKYIELSMMMGKEYVDILIKLITYQHMALVYLGAIIGGLIGANIGRVLLKKTKSKSYNQVFCCSVTWVYCSTFYKSLFGNSCCIGDIYYVPY